MFKCLILNGKRFLFKYDYDTISNDYLPHIFVRHLVEPEEAARAFLNITSQEYNIKYNRYESYSEKDDLYIYWNFFKNKPDIILIMSAFRI